MTNPVSDPKKPQSQGRQETEEELISTVEIKEERKLRARRNRGNSVWFGFGMFGMVGWSITIPTIISLAIGIWIDGRWPSPYSWTLMFLFVGVVLGCLNAWYWVKREHSQIEYGQNEHGDVEGGHIEGGQTEKDGN
jgi:ATP synthase protein I